VSRVPGRHDHRPWTTPAKCAHDDRLERIWIRRGICRPCNKTFTILPDWLVPFGFRILYVFVVLEIGSRQIFHCNGTEHPTAEWTLQQLCEAIPGRSDVQFLLHDRDNIFSVTLHCERLIGTIRCECLDYVIPFGERHLRRILPAIASRQSRLNDGGNTRTE
jgi:hypothetical protein